MHANESNLNDLSRLVIGGGFTVPIFLKNFMRMPWRTKYAKPGSPLSTSEALR